MYEIGSYIMKNSSGVCKVDSIVYLDADSRAKDKKHYLLIPVGEPNGRVYVSVENAEVATRELISKNEANDLISRIDSIEEPLIENDKQREPLYKETIKARKPEELVAMIKLIHKRKVKRLAEGKKSTATDDRYVKIAEDYLYSELGFVLGIDKKEVAKIITEAINKN